MTMLLEVRDLTVAFATREGPLHAVNGVDFDLPRGEVLGILGESGSGKSVSLRALVGLLPRRTTTLRGSVRFEGRELVGLPERQMGEVRGPGIAMIFQEPMTALDPVFTVGEQIAEAVRRHEGVSQREAMGRARELFDRVQIPSTERRLRAFPHELSGGMRQRAMIALALSCRPSVLLADEPTTALDVTVQIQIILLLRELQRELGMGVVFVTHDVGVAAEISDRVAVMYAGRFVETGSAIDVIEAPRHPYTAGLLSSTVHGSMRGRRLTAIGGMPPDMRALPGGCPFAPRCPHAVPRCEAETPREAEVAPGHTTRCLRVAAGELALDEALPA
ncbi:ABC transporter ATP-binding protein [Acuticoccus sp.]|uniref:ABC transporter ATP-binding protein n=1 Tax=Acuticoccus sp. TaxID=1904378 RepID=UPI003B528BAC